MSPIEARFKTAVRNAILNILEKRQTRRRNIPTTPIRREFEPGGVTSDDIAARSVPGDDEMVEEFRRSVRDRLGDLALAILDLRLSGEGDTKTLVGAEEFGKPSSYRVKETVKAIKSLAREFGDEGFRRMVEKAMEAEGTTLKRRFAVQDLSSQTD